MNINYFILIIMVFLLKTIAVASQNTVDSDYYFNKGYEFYSKYDFENALYWFDRSIEKKLNLAYSYSYKGSCELFLKQIEAGKNDLDSAFRYDSSFATLYYFRNYQYSLLGMLDSAIYYAKIAIKMSPKEALFYDALATSYKNKKMLDSALIFGKKAVELNPNSYTFLNNLGTIEIALEKYEVAITRFEICVKRHPEDILARTNIAICKYKLKHYEEAINICNYVIAREPKYSYPYLVRGLTYFDEGDKVKACSDFRKLYSFEEMQKTAIEYYNKCDCDK